MKEILNEIEAIKIGIDIEQQGFKFYASAEEHAKDPNIGELFGWLAKEELNHIDDFKSLLDTLLKDKEKLTGYDDPAVTEYLRYLVKAHIFSSPEETARLSEHTEDQIEAINIAIQLEKDSIMFYTELMENSQSPEGMKAFAHLIEEEKKHLKLLVDKVP